jgi:hypothetical protein
MVSDVLFQGYECGFPWCCFMVHSESLTAEYINTKVRVYFTEYITASRKAGIKPCIGAFITFLRREKGMIVNQEFNITPERLDL